MMREWHIRLHETWGSYTEKPRKWYEECNPDEKGSIHVIEKDAVFKYFVELLKNPITRDLCIKMATNEIPVENLEQEVEKALKEKE
jgi:hypothetical protein